LGRLCQIANGRRGPYPSPGKGLHQCDDKDKRSIVFIAKKLVDFGFEIVATKGTAKVLTSNGIPVQTVLKVGEGRPDIVDRIKNGEIDLVINTQAGKSRGLMR